MTVEVTRPDDIANIASDVALLRAHLPSLASGRLPTQEERDRLAEEYAIAKHKGRELGHVRAQRRLDMTPAETTAAEVVRLLETRDGAMAHEQMLEVFRDCGAPINVDHASRHLRATTLLTLGQVSANDVGRWEASGSALELSEWLEAERGRAWEDTERVLRERPREFAARFTDLDIEHGRVRPEDRSWVIDLSTLTFERREAAASALIARMRQRHRIATRQLYAMPSRRAGRAPRRCRSTRTRRVTRGADPDPEPPGRHPPLRRRRRSGGGR